VTDPFFSYISIKLFIMGKVYKIVLSLLFATGVFLFWLLVFPQALGFQEQNQLFLYTCPYLAERLSVAGGLADYVSEFLTQFYYHTWVGALILAALFVAFQVLVSRISKIYALSFAPALALLVYMGDIYVLPSFLVALILTTLLCVLYDRWPSVAFSVVAIPAGMWLLGPAMWLFVAFVAIKDRKWMSLGYIPYAFLLTVLAKLTVSAQYPFWMLFSGINYFRLPIHGSILREVVPALVLLAAFCPQASRKVFALSTEFGVLAILLIMTSFGIRKAYDTDTYEIIAYDQMIRNEKFNDVVRRAEKYQPKVNISAVSVNLSLFMTGQINRMPEFYQYGTDGVLMPRVRDLISNVSTCEAFYRLGFINSALRYAFDTQESTGNNRKSGRFMKKMVECHIVNGNYAAAKKYIDILKNTQYYDDWAENMETYLGDEQKINSDPFFGYARQTRFRDDFLYNYEEMDKMLAILYHHNNNNIMAAAYYQMWKMLEGGEE